MTNLERILGALFWLPILLGGIVGIALVEPDFRRIGIVSAILLGLFLIFVLVQVGLERRAFARSRNEETAIARKSEHLRMKSPEPVRDNIDLS